MRTMSDTEWIMVRSDQGSHRSTAQWTGHKDRGDGVSRCGMVATIGTGTTKDAPSLQGDKRYCKRCDRRDRHTRPMKPGEDTMNRDGERDDARSHCHRKGHVMKPGEDTMPHDWTARLYEAEGTLYVVGLLPDKMAVFLPECDLVSLATDVETFGASWDERDAYWEHEDTRGLSLVAEWDGNEMWIAPDASNAARSYAEGGTDSRLEAMGMS